MDYKIFNRHCILKFKILGHMLKTLYRIIGWFGFIYFYYQNIELSIRLPPKRLPYIFSGCPNTFNTGHISIPCGKLQQVRPNDVWTCVARITSMKFRESIFLAKMHNYIWCSYGIPSFIEFDSVVSEEMRWQGRLWVISKFQGA